MPAFGAATGRRNVLHPFRRTRPGQTRGIPYLAPVMELVKQLGRYSEAEVAANPRSRSAILRVAERTHALQGHA